MRRPSLWLGILLLIGAASVWLSHRPTQYSAAGAVTTLTPVVAPGDEVSLLVTVTGGMRIGVEKARVVGRGVDVEVKGRGAWWGGSLRVKRDDRGVDAVLIRVPLPRDYPSDGQLLVEVDTITASPSDEPRFTNHRAEAALPVSLAVLSPSRRTWTWAFLWVAAVAWLAIGTVQAAATLAEKRRVERDGGALPRPWLAALLGGFAVGTFYIVARPIGMVTGWFDDLPQVGITAVALAAAGAVAYSLTGKPRPDPIPGTVTPTAATATPDYRSQVLRIDDDGWRACVALVDADGRFSRRNAPGGISIGYAGRKRFTDSWVALRRDADDDAKLTVSFNDSTLLFAVAQVLVGSLDRLRLDLERGGALFTYEIDTGTDVDAVVHAFRTGQRERLALQRVRSDFIELLASRAEQLEGGPPP